MDREVRTKGEENMADYEMERGGASVRVTLRGKLTSLEVQSLQPALKKEIAEGVREIVFDLAATTMLDSTGIGLLVAASNSLAAVQGAVRMVNVSPDILKLLQNMKLIDRLHATAGERQVSDVDG
jgi:anti-sigma B factor antagonist